MSDQPTMLSRNPDNRERTHWLDGPDGTPGCWASHRLCARYKVEQLTARAEAAEQQAAALRDGVESDSPTWPLVLAFAVEMERKLAQNRHKGDRAGWLKDEPVPLAHRILDEYAELRDAIGRNSPSAHVYEEAADVANFALMVADSYGHRVGKGLLERRAILAASGGAAPAERAGGE